MPRSKQQQQVPVHTAETDTPLRFLLEYVQGGPGSVDEELQRAHRDDHYIFFLQEEGRTQLMIDFERVALNGAVLCFIGPGQVHHYLQHEARGWFMAADISLVSDHCRMILENAENSRQYVQLENDRQHLNCLQLIQAQLHNGDTTATQRAVLGNLAAAFIGMAAARFESAEKPANRSSSRAGEITYRFRQLVKANFITLKKPGDYARLLNISLAYLNEVVKAGTGFPPSYWIQQEIFLEAKRLLYYTDHDAKEIAFRTGYEDHAYFSRLFRKVTGLTPLGFRAKYRDSSNHSL